MPSPRLTPAAIESAIEAGETKGLLAGPGIIRNLPTGEQERFTASIREGVAAMVEAALSLDGWRGPPTDDELLECARIMHVMGCGSNCPHDPSNWISNAKMVAEVFFGSPIDKGDSER